MSDFIEFVKILFSSWIGWTWVIMLIVCVGFLCSADERSGLIDALEEIENSEEE